jgi:hypothetical protein
MILSFNMAMNTSVDLDINILNGDSKDVFFDMLLESKYIPDINRKVIRNRQGDIVGQILVSEIRDGDTDYGHYEMQ